MSVKRKSYSADLGLPLEGTKQNCF